VAGVLDHGDDEDCFVFEAEVGKTYVIETYGSTDTTIGLVTQYSESYDGSVDRDGGEDTNARVAWTADEQEVAQRNENLVNDRVNVYVRVFGWHLDENGAYDSGMGPTGPYELLVTERDMDSLFPSAESVLAEPVDLEIIEIAPGITARIGARELVAELKRSATAADYEDVLKFLGERGASAVGQLPKLRILQIRAEDGVDLLQLASDLRALSYIEDAYPSWIGALPGDHFPVPPPGDPDFPESWWVDHADYGINAPQAWGTFVDRGEMIGSPDVTIGVVDARLEIDSGHFLMANIRELNWVPFTYDHGTAVTALAIASGDDGSGMAGVAWDCPCVFYNAYLDWPFNGPWYPLIVWGVESCIDAGARVVNVSLGADQELPNDEFLVKQRDFRRAIKTAIEYAANHDALVVVAAGNRHLTNDDELFPPDMDNKAYWEGLWQTNAMIATTINRQGFIEDVSGDVVDITAPGSQVTKAKKDGSLGPGWGTSLAAPMATGAAALVFSRYPELSATQVKNTLIESACQDANGTCRREAHDADGPAGIGILDLHGAVTYFDQPTGVVFGLFQQLDSPERYEFAWIDPNTLELDKKSEITKEGSLVDRFAVDPRAHKAFGLFSHDGDLSWLVIDIATGATTEQPLADNLNLKEVDFDSGQRLLCGLHSSGNWDSGFTYEFVLIDPETLTETSRTDLATFNCGDWSCGTIERLVVDSELHRAYLEKRPSGVVGRSWVTIDIESGAVSEIPMPDDLSLTHLVFDTGLNVLCGDQYDYASSEHELVWVDPSTLGLTSKGVIARGFFGVGAPVVNPHSHEIYCLTAHLEGFSVDPSWLIVDIRTGATTERPIPEEYKSSITMADMGFDPNLNP